MIIPRGKIEGDCMIPLLSHISAKFFNPSNINFFFTSYSFTYLMFMMSLNSPSEPLGTTPRGLTTSGLSSSWKIEIASATRISSIAEVAKHVWARAEGEFLEILGVGASAIHCNSKPLSI
jgi:hypothetical protein